MTANAIFFDSKTQKINKARFDNLQELQNLMSNYFYITLGIHCEERGEKLVLFHNESEFSKTNSPSAFSMKTDAKRVFACGDIIIVKDLELSDFDDKEIILLVNKFFDVILLDGKKCLCFEVWTAETEKWHKIDEIIEFIERPITL